MAIKNFLVFIFLLTCSGINAQSDSVAKTRLIILHPTALYLDYYSNLIKNKILPDTIEYICVYHVDENYDYSGVQKYADSIGISVRFIPVRGNLSEKDVFAENLCTPMFRYLFTISSGVIFNGGPDIQPELYGAETSLMTGITDPARHFFEMSFMFHLLGSTKNPAYKPFLDERPDYMILGICLGMQTMVAATGGSLVQDIPSEIYKKKTVEQVMALGNDRQHKNYFKVKYPRSETVSWGTLHTIKTDGNYGFWNDCKWESPVQVYSYHHQAVKKLAPGFFAVAWSADKKVIEAVAHSKYSNVLGVQFHPEPDFLYLPLKKLYLAEGDKMTIGRVLEGDKLSAQFIKLFWHGIVSRLR